MASARATWSFGGRVALVALLLLGVTTVLFDHPLPALGVGFVALLVLASLPGRSALERIDVLPLPPAWLFEDEERLLDAPYRLAGGSAPLAVRVDARGPAVDVRGAMPLLPPSELGRLPLRVKGLKRGHHRRIPLTLSAAGPFGWRPFDRMLEIAADLWVMPRPRALRERVLEEMLALRPRGLDRPQPTGPGEGEFYALKHFRPGDPERRVHARLSARVGRKVIRLFRGEAPPLVHLLVDPRLGEEGSAFGLGDFDEAMRFAAGVVRALLLRNVPVSLSMMDAHGPRLAVAPTCRKLDSFLTALAVARPLSVEADEAAPEVPGGTLPGSTAAGHPDGRRVVIHLGRIDESRLPSDVIAIQAGSRRYYQLLDMHWRGAAGASRGD